MSVLHICRSWKWFLWWPHTNSNSLEWYQQQLEDQCAVKSHETREILVSFSSCFTAVLMCNRLQSGCVVCQDLISQSVCVCVCVWVCVRLRVLACVCLKQHAQLVVGWSRLKLIPFIPRRAPLSAVTHSLSPLTSTSLARSPLFFSHSQSPCTLSRLCHWTAYFWKFSFLHFHVSFSIPPSVPLYTLGYSSRDPSSCRSMSVSCKVRDNWEVSKGRWTLVESSTGEKTPTVDQWTSWEKRHTHYRN